MKHRGRIFLLAMLLPLAAFLSTCSDSSTGLFSGQGSSGGGTGGGTDTIAPTVVSTSPGINATDVLTSELTVVFSETLDPSSVNNTTVTLVGPEGNINGTVTLNGSKVFFAPNDSLASNVTYELQLSDNIKDVAGNGLVNKHSMTFTTGLVKAIYAKSGYFFSLLLKNDGTVWSWGSNQYGQLGDGTTTDRWTIGKVKNLSGIVSIALSWDFAIALKNDGTVRAWGHNDAGQLGDGTITDRSTPVMVTNLTGIKKITTSARNAHALKSDGTVFGWGWNNGLLGDGTLTNRSIPVIIPGLVNIIDISSGSQGHTVTLKSDGTVFAWGGNVFGEVGDNTTTTRTSPVQVKNLSGVTKISAGADHSLALDSSNKIWAWGYNGNNQLGDGTNAHSYIPINLITLPFGAKMIDAGSRGSSAILDNGTILIWGHFGISSIHDYLTPTPIPYTGFDNTSVFTCGLGDFTFSGENILMDNGTLYGWGVGLPGNTSASDPVVVSNTLSQSGYSISGTVSANGTGISGVKITLSGAGSVNTLTDSNGNYQIGALNGSYTITASKSGYSFTPASIQLTVSGGPITTQNFVGTIVSPSYSITGKVTAGGLGLSGVTVTLSGSSITSTTDPGGNYTFSNVLPGTYTVTPAKTGYGFTPASRSVTITSTSVSVPDFVGIAGGVLSVVSTDPAAGATGVSKSIGGIIVNFNKDVNSSTVTTSSFQISPTIPGLIVSPNGNIRSYVLMTVISNFAPNTQYTVTIKGTIQDTAGNPLGQDYVFRFTTGP